MSQSNKSTARDELLHRLHDGELEPAERARIEAAISGGDDLSRDKLAALDELGGALRGLYRAQAETFDAWPAIEQQIAAAKVIPFSKRLRKRGALWMSMSTFAAAAAVVAVLLIPRGDHPSNECEVNEIEATGAVNTILKLADDDHGGSTTVVWIEE